MPARPLAPALLLVACALACTNTANRVAGGVNTTPPLIIRAVQSSIFAQVTATDPTGGTSSANAVVIAETDHLCALLAEKPDLLKRTDTAFTAIVLLTPADKLGSFYFTNGGAVSASFTASAGTGSPPLAWVGSGGNISLGEFDPGGKSTGNFDVLFSDGAGQTFESYGVFQGQPCPALAQAYVPRRP